MVFSCLTILAFSGSTVSTLLKLLICFELFDLTTLGALSLLFLRVHAIRASERSSWIVRISSLLLFSSRKSWKVGLPLLQSSKIVISFVLVSSNICRFLTLITRFYSSIYMWYIVWSLNLTSLLLRVFETNFLLFNFCSFSQIRM